MPAPDFADVASLSEVPEEGVLSVTLPTGEQACLVRCGGVVSAFVDSCPHQGMPLSAGDVLPDGTLQCAWHGARFDCRTGEVRQGPAEDNARALEVRVLDGRVWVRGEG